MTLRVYKTEKLQDGSVVGVSYRPNYVDDQIQLWSVRHPRLAWELCLTGLSALFGIWPVMFALAAQFHGQAIDWFFPAVGLILLACLLIIGLFRLLIPSGRI